MSNLRKNRVLVLVGSKSDHAQLRAGLARLVNDDRVEFIGLATGSIHRNTAWVLALAKVVSGQGVPDEFNDDVLLQQIYAIVSLEPVDYVIVAAGWANHLTGTFDAYLRHTLKTRWPRVIGVAIEDTDEKLGWWQRMTHTMAACLSIIGVPGTQVICASDRTDDPCLVGEAGFLEACELAAGLYLCADDLPPLPTPKSPDFMDRHAVLAWLSD